jgi:hypothetical protein
MVESRRRATPAEVDEAIQEIQAYHRAGQRSLKQVPGKSAYAQAEVQTQAEALQWNETKLRKARQFANLYRKKDLAELFRLLRKHRPVFGVSFIGVLVTIPDRRERVEVQRWCILQNASFAALEREIKIRRPDQRQGGRRRRVGDDPLHALVQLEEMSDSWLRWYKAVKPKGAAKGETLFDRLTADVQQQVEKVRKAMEQLHETVTEALDRARFGARRRRKKRK